MVRAFHWQYGDILLAIYFFVFTYYVVLSLKNKYTILLYYTLSVVRVTKLLVCDFSIHPKTIVCTLILQTAICLLVII